MKGDEGGRLHWKKWAGLSVSLSKEGKKGEKQEGKERVENI